MHVFCDHPNPRTPDYNVNYENTGAKQYLLDTALDFTPIVYVCNISSRTCAKLRPEKNLI